MESNGTNGNSTNSQNAFEKKAKPIKNSKLNNLIKKSLLLISTLAGVAIGTLIGAYILIK